jgi:hypothetical protein
MTLVSIVVVLVVVGLLLSLINLGDIPGVHMPRLM